jgi:hypothetical protein
MTQNYLNCHLDCKCSHCYGIVVGNEQYIHKFQATNAWYDYSFIFGFLALFNHVFHNEVPKHKKSNVVVKMVAAQTPKSVVKQHNVTQCEDGVTHLVTVVYKNSHFAVLLFDFHDRHVMVYDGLNATIKRWTKHVSIVLRKYGLERWDEEPQIRVGFDCVGHTVETTPWTIEKHPVLKQHNGFNCGPIACLKVMEIYCMLPHNSIETIRQSVHGYWEVVMEFYQKFLKKYT